MTLGIILRSPYALYSIYLRAVCRNPLGDRGQPLTTSGVPAVGALGGGFRDVVFFGMKGLGIRV